MDQAMRKTTTLALIVATGLAHAQVWCPAGAVWNYNLMSFMVEGCETRTYVGDTVIDGRIAQRITVSSLVMNYMTNQTESYQSEVYTSVEPGIVLLWNSMGNSGWDTLYWFSAVPGDRWYPPGADDLCSGQEPSGVLEVADTGSVIVSGLPLRYVDVSYVDQFGEAGIDPFRITERLGAPLMFIPPGGCFVSEAGGGLRTYVDDSFPAFDSGEADLCDLITVLADTVPALNDAIIPNPGTEQFTVPLAPWEVSTVSVIDAAGRIILHNISINGTITIDASTWSSGVFQVLVRDDHGKVRNLRWIKL
jgi:hypothetical protein